MTKPMGNMDGLLKLSVILMFVALAVFDAKAMQAMDESRLVTDGKLLYEMGILDQAEIKLQAVLTNNPDNLVACYYSDLVATARQQRSSGGTETVSNLDSTNLFTRMYKIHLEWFFSALKQETGFNSTNVQDQTRMIGTICSNAGATNAAVFYDGQQGEIYIRASAKSQGLVELLLQKLNYREVQISMEARFVEYPEGVDSLYGVSFFTCSNGLAGIVDDWWMRFRGPDSIPSAKTLCRSNWIAGSASECLLRATTRTLVTNSIFLGASANPSVTMQVTNMQFGSLLDFVPTIIPSLFGGHGINLTLAASQTKFMGFCDPDKLPAVDVRQASIDTYVPNGQTLAISPCTYFDKDPNIARQIEEYEKKNGRKQLVIFITPTLVAVTSNGK